MSCLAPPLDEPHAVGMLGEGSPTEEEGASGRRGSPGGRRAGWRERRSILFIKATHVVIRLYKIEIVHNMDRR